MAILGRNGRCVFQQPQLRRHSVLPAASQKLTNAMIEHPLTKVTPNQLSRLQPRRLRVTKLFAGRRVAPASLAPGVRRTPASSPPPS